MNRTGSVCDNYTIYDEKKIVGKSILKIRVREAIKNITKKFLNCLLKS